MTESGRDVQSLILEANRILDGDRDPLFLLRIKMVWDDDAFYDFVGPVMNAVVALRGSNDVPRRLCVLVYRYLGALRALLANERLHGVWALEAVPIASSPPALFAQRIAIIDCVQKEFEMPGTVDPARLLARDDS